MIILLFFLSKLLSPPSLLHSQNPFFCVCMQCSLCSNHTKMEKVEEELRVAELKQQEIDNLGKVSSSLLLFSLQCKNLVTHYDRVEILVKEKYEEAKSNLRRQSEEAEKKLEGRELELMRKEKNLIGLRKGVFEETKNKREEYLEMEGKVEEVKRKVERREKVVLWKEKRVEEMRQDALLKEEEVSKQKELVDKGLGELEVAESKLRLLEMKIDEKLKELESREERVNRIVRLTEEECEKFQVKEAEFNAMNKYVEVLLEELKLKEASFSMIQGKIYRGIALLEVKEKTFNSIRKEIDQSNDKLDLKKKSLDLFQEQVNQLSSDLEMKEKSLDLTQISIKQAFDDFEAKEKCYEEDIDRRIAEVEGKQLRLEERTCEVELKEKCLLSLKKTLEEQVLSIIANCSREEQEESRSKEQLLASIQNMIKRFLNTSIKKSYKELELKEKRMNSIPCMLVKTGETDYLPGYDAEDALTADIRFFVSMDGKTLQIFLNNQLRKNEYVRDEVPTALKMSLNPPKLVLDAMQGFNPPHLRDGDLEFETSVVRETCIFLLNKLRKMSPFIEPCVKAKAAKLAKEWNDKIKLETMESLQVLGFLELVVTYGLMDAFDSTELLSYIESVSGHGGLSELQKALGFAEMVPCGAICGHSTTEPAQSEVYEVHQAFEVACMNDQCAVSDGESMLLLLKEHSKNQEILLDRVSAALLASGNAAELVLDALKLYYSQLSSLKDDNELRASFILLLRQLMTTAPKIEPRVRKDAMKLASKWKELIDKAEHDSISAVLSFLWILAAYGLGSDYADNVVIELLKTIIASTEARDTCHALGFEKKIREHVEGLIQNKQWLDAAKCVCAFGLEKVFQVVHLLEEQGKLCKNDAERTQKTAFSPAVQQVKENDRTRRHRENKPERTENKRLKTFMPANAARSAEVGTTVRRLIAEYGSHFPFSTNGNGSGQIGHHLRASAVPIPPYLHSLSVPIRTHIAPRPTLLPFTSPSMYSFPASNPIPGVRGHCSAPSYLYDPIYITHRNFQP